MPPWKNPTNPAKKAREFQQSLVKMNRLKCFGSEQIKIVNNAVAMAEELVSNHYKMSASQWLGPRYDVKTLVELNPAEIIDGPFAQIIRYRGRRKNTSLGSATYDFYKICLQDHTIQSTLEMTPKIELFPFSLYIITHELIHIVRFSKFLQNFEASDQERMVEEKRVHQRTHEILKPVQVAGLASVLEFYNDWHVPYEGMRDP
jgi:excinuclease UvrABC helicase subunit UvrB